MCSSTFSHKMEVKRNKCSTNMALALLSTHNPVPVNAVLSMTGNYRISFNIYKQTQETPEIKKNVSMRD